MKVIPESVLTKSIDSIVSDLYKSAKDTVKKKLEIWKYDNSKARLLAKSKQILNVKTIWQIDKPVNLLKFYYPTKIQIQDSSIEINSIWDLKTEHQIVLEGIVGQGKSILLRYLCYRELVYGERIPIFFELRYFDNSSRLLDKAKEYFSEVGLPVNDAVIKHILENGKVVIFLDGFDEISAEAKHTVLGNVEKFVKTYSQVRIVISTRPGDEISKSFHFEVYKLAYLQEHDVYDLIERLSEDKEITAALVNALKNKKNNLHRLVKTPLFVTILTFIYKSTRQIPDNIPDFFEFLFSILINRHDSTKAGFRRPKKCNLDDRQYRQIFENICFSLKPLSKQKFTHEEVYKATEISIQAFSKKYNLNLIGTQDFIDDITAITFLLLREGDIYRFIHKSIQEYFCASYVKNKPEDWIRSFYDSFKNRISHEWIEEISFLKEIDTFKYRKYFLLPHLKVSIDLIKDCQAGSEIKSNYDVKKVLELFRYKIRVFLNEVYSFSHRNIEKPFELIDDSFSSNLFKINFDLFWKDVLAEAREEEEEQEAKIEEDGSMVGYEEINIYFGERLLINILEISAEYISSEYFDLYFKNSEECVNDVKTVNLVALYEIDHTRRTLEKYVKNYCDSLNKLYEKTMQEINAEETWDNGILTVWK